MELSHIKSETVAKRAIQAGALCYIALGTWLGHLSYQLFVQTITGQCFGISLCFLVPLSATAFAIAVQNIRSPGAIAVRNLVAATTVALCYGIIFLLLKNYWLPESVAIATIIFMSVPLICAGLYLLICHFLLPIASYKEPIFSAHILESRINRQEISDPAKKSLAELMASRYGSTAFGYFLIVCSWFLFSLSIFYTIMSGYLANKNPDALTDDTYKLTVGLFWGAVVIYSIGKAHLKK
jgi:ABC-type dipeptide/oligopeptide/nickel transport system permease component